MRPLVIELLLGFGCAALYWWEIECAGLIQAMAPTGFVVGPVDRMALQTEFASQMLLIIFMLAATLVDIDEQTIPDLITVPGTLLGLLVAAVWPRSLLPYVAPAAVVPAVEFLTLSSPAAWPARLAPFPNGLSLIVGLLCFIAWCAALLPLRRHTRHGWIRALRLLAARWINDPLSTIVLGITAAGSVGVVAAWWVGGDTWRGLLSALVGMAAGGALIWAVRIAAGWALGREAMGFGDVTLMAMIGSYLGWQTGPLVFFLAPLAGLVVGLIQWFLYRDNVIPYGPFLCLAALTVIVAWGPLWVWVEPFYEIQWLVPGAMLACLMLLAVLLGAWRALRSVTQRRR